MLTAMHQILAPPIFKDDEKTHVAALLNVILLAVVVMALSYGFPALLVAINPAPIGVTMGVLVVAMLGLRFLARYGQIYVASLGLTVVLWILCAVAALAAGSVQTPGFSSYLSVILISTLLLGGRAGL